MAKLTPATELASRNTAHFPNESPEYRSARDALLAEEIELRRHSERVAEMRRNLPAGGEVPKDYAFESEDGPVSLSQLFGDKETLFVYSYMFGPQRKNPCPMCTSLLDALALKVPNIADRVAFAVAARSPVERLAEWKRTHGWPDMPLVSDASGEYTRAYVSAEDADVPAMTVFTRHDGKIRHFWSAEISDEMADPGQDPRGHIDFDPLWHILDLTPRGRNKEWYPRLLNSQAVVTLHWTNPAGLALGGAATSFAVQQAGAVSMFLSNRDIVELTNFRHALHRHAEISGEESGTARAVVGRNLLAEESR